MLITDLDLPGLSGYDLARSIRDDERLSGSQRIPILALSASVTQDEPVRCRAAGMDDFAAKPTTIPFLASRLQRWLPHLDWRREPAAQPTRALGGVVDLEVLAELAAGDADLVASIRDDYLQTTRSDLRALRTAVDSQNAVDVGRLAHRMKGAARIDGASAVVDVAQRLENDLRAGAEDWAQIRTLADRLQMTFDDVEGAAAGPQVQ